MVTIPKLSIAEQRQLALINTALTNVGASPWLIAILAGAQADSELDFKQLENGLKIGYEARKAGLKALELLTVPKDGTL